VRPFSCFPRTTKLILFGFPRFQDSDLRMTNSVT
jgi:hypothetical protein